ncbi:MAG: AAA family ATPase [Muribaculaceae bacterium]|nr:AAA family ATPase [Muribaculaceae bacterium]
MQEYRYPEIYKTLNSDQKIAFQMLAYGQKSGKNYFLTGDAGTGKSYLIDAFYQFCCLNGITMLKCAPTGVAATNIGGVTMHRMFRLPLSVLTDKIEGTQFANIYKLVSRADVMFIDEISMARVDVFGNAMAQVREANKIRARNSKPPVQIIVCGDFGQLMPVVTDKDREIYQQLTGADIGTGCCYNSHWWSDLDFQPILLSQPMRQSDQAFCRALDNLKLGIKSDIDYLNANTAQQPLKDGIWLCGYNNTAAEKNARGIYNLPGEVLTSRAVITGKANIKQTNFAENLLYKPGARVVMTMRELGNRNSPYDNGSLGTILEARRDFVKIRLDRGVTVDVPRVKLPFYEYEVCGSSVEPREVGTVTQFPFKIGYAITIHKSQGQTYDKMNVVPEIFAPGQLYVAMSRCREIANIYVQPDGYGRRITPEKILPNPEVIKFLISQDAMYADFKSYFEKNIFDPAA